MEKNQFKIQLRGISADEEHVRLVDFLEELSAIKEALVEIDKKISDTNAPTTDYRIVDLSHSSPSTVMIEAIPLDSKNGKNNSAEVVESFFYGLDKIQKGVAPDIFDSAILEKYRKIAGGFKRKVTEIKFYHSDSTISLHKNLEHEIALILGEDEIGDGYVEGDLEMINFHKGVNKFTIYPSVGSDKVICHFSKNILVDAIKAVGEYIRVVGKLKYKKRDRFPYAIEVIEIVIYPQENDIPSLASLRGVAPNSLQGLTSEEFVRRVRHGK